MSSNHGGGYKMAVVLSSTFNKDGVCYYFLDRCFSTLVSTLLWNIIFNKTVNKLKIELQTISQYSIFQVIRSVILCLHNFVCNK